MEDNKQKTIVVIDDEEIVTSSIETLLSLETDYKTLTFNNPNEVIDAIKNTPIDLVICDFFMKEMNGIKLLKEIRNLYPDIPLVMLTGYADKENTIKAINEVSLYYYLEKPWDNNELLLVIKNGLEKGNLISQLQSKMAELEDAYRQLEEAQQEIINKEKMSTIGQMASKIIHDLKNPMSAISGFAELIVKVSEDKKSSDSDYQKIFGEIKNFAQIILEEVKRLVDMVTEILQYAKGDELYNKAKLPLKSVILTTLSVIKETFKKENINIQIETSADDFILEIDHDKIIRMLYNILYNSRDAMKEKGGGNIIVKIDKPENDIISLAITDDGKGMPDEIKQRVFEPFVTYGKPNGTGLGMAIVKKIVEAHNGTITVESELNKGTTFTILFKREPE